MVKSIIKFITPKPLALGRYFGLQYTNSHGDKCWLRLERRVSDQDIKKESILQFQFKVKFYPEVCEDEVIQASTLHLFYLQVLSFIKLFA